MQWSKSFVNILLFVVFVSLVKCSSTYRVENNTAWLKKYLKEIGEKQHDETSKIKPTTQVFEESTKSLVLSSEAKRQKLENDKRRLHSNPVIVASKEHHINNGIKPHGANNPFLKIPEKNYSGKKRRNIVNGNRDVKQTSLQSDIINRKLSKDEANFREFSNPGKEINKRMVSSPRIAKRNVYLNDTKQPIPPACTGKRSCSGRCTGNITEWGTDESFTCYCDAACYEIFNDCCSDYTKYCGEQKRTNIFIKKFKWTCEPLGNFTSVQKCEIGERVWMVSGCANGWPRDIVRRKCENPEKFSRKYVPAMSGNVTFRNYFCARCNHITENFKYFSAEIETNVIPPKHYNFKQKFNFLLSVETNFTLDGQSRPKTFQKRRYCLKSVIDSCPSNITSEPCTNGSVELVSGAKPFKNYNCALCNDPYGQYTCFPSFSSSCYFTQRQRFLLTFDYQKKRPIFSVLNTLCRSKGLQFDDELEECVDDIPPPSGNEGRIRILAWLVPSKDFQFTENDFKTAMKQYLGVEHSQIYNVSITQTYPSLSSTILFHLVRSTLILTPEQIFDILFETDSNIFRLNLRSFIHFEKPLNVTLNNITYTIIKTTSRPLSCSTRFNGAGLFKNVYGNKKMCEEYHSRRCNTTQTGLTKKDFIINHNLSIHHKNTGMLYKLGQYDVLKGSIAVCNLNIPTCASENSCKGRCSKQTEWRTEIKMRCSCDPDCYEVFNDCCSDYTKYCGVQKPTETRTKKYHYTCEQFGPYNTEKNTTRFGFWMVTECRPDWPDNTFRTKCEEPLGDLNMSSPDLYAHFPVLGGNNVTFRNLYCAICNDVKEYELWPFYVIRFTKDTPPKNYTLTEKIQFFLSHWAIILGRGPGMNQARRYCLKEIINSCPLGVKFDSCMQGDVALIRIGHSYYKNTHCAACHGRLREQFSCFSGKYFSDLSEKYIFIQNYTYLPYLKARRVTFRGMARYLMYGIDKVLSPIRPIYSLTVYPDKSQETLFVQASGGEVIDSPEIFVKPNENVLTKHILTKCNGSIVLYAIDEYNVTVNSSIYLDKTASLYNYEEYEVLSNKSVAICHYHKVNIITETRRTIRDNEVLAYITFISFLLSIFSLIFVLVTYILFPQLRTLPGKNLMNFAASLLLFKIAWLPLKMNEIRSDKTICMAMGIIAHYFLMASFVSMSVIAFHTCKIFARRLPAPKMSEGHERKLFWLYLAFVWVAPGIFVGICVVLDYHDVVKIGYGESEICWLTEDNAYTYFVIIPIGVLLLFNIITFVTAVIYLRKHGQNTAARQASGNRRSNFLIYVKISTLMGFTWLLGLLAIVVTSTTIFWYFFVIFTSLQGVFVAVAFVMNVKTFGLYKQWYSSGSRAPKAIRPRRNVPTNV